MSLPAGQQRVLDGIADALRKTEPRLASMFAIFTRLSKDEPPPRREQLAAVGPIALLAAVCRRPPRRDTTSGRRTRRLMVVMSQLAIAFVVLAALVGLTSLAPGPCTRPVRSAPVAAYLHQACRAQAGVLSPAGR
ncbi:MAG TPA: hypothetical protein VMA32_08105 [Streptosporangiaceae bacterium]|nr:hypothetical protein [Streptosporangiaceae bacterium]